MAISLGDKKSPEVQAPTVAKHYLDICDVAAQLNLTNTDVRRLVALRKLKAVPVPNSMTGGDGSTLKILISDLETFGKAYPMVTPVPNYLGVNWKVPLGMLDADYPAESKVKTAFSNCCKELTTDAEVRATMIRTAKPNQRPQDVDQLEFTANSAPRALVEAWNGPATSNGFIRMAGEKQVDIPTLGYAFLRSRIYNLAKKVLADFYRRGAVGPSTEKLIQILYSSGDALEGVIEGVKARLVDEVIVGRETRLIDFKLSEARNGDVIETLVQKTPVKITYEMPLTALASVSELRSAVAKYF